MTKRQRDEAGEEGAEGEEGEAGEAGEEDEEDEQASEEAGEEEDRAAVRARALARRSGCALSLCIRAVSHDSRELATARSGCYGAPGTAVQLYLCVNFAGETDSVGVELHSTVFFPTHL